MYGLRCHQHVIISTSVAPHEIPDGIGRRQVNSLPSKLSRGYQVSGPDYMSYQHLSGSA